MLKLDNISLKLGEFSLDNLSLEINQGEYFVILGPTGAGKTILLEIIAGLHGHSGRIYKNNVNITETVPEKRKFGFVYQDYALFPHFSVEKNIKYPLPYIKDPLDFNWLIQMLNIRPILHRSIGTLSGGEQQRVALARALITNPELMLLDEPLGALDPVTSEAVRSEIKKIHKETGKTFIHVTHNFDEALYLGDRLAIIHQGKLLQIGTPEAIFTKPDSEFLANFVNAGNILKGNIVGSKLQIGNVIISVSTDKSGEHRASIRPEDILLSKNRIESSARNSFAGKVINIVSRGAIYDVFIDVGVILKAFITKASLEELNLNIGSEVYATFKATAVHIF